VRRRHDALGNPIGFFLTGGEAHDLVGADHLLPTTRAWILVLSPPRERPIAWSSPAIFGRRRYAGGRAQ